MSRTEPQVQSFKYLTDFFLLLRTLLHRKLNNLLENGKELILRLELENTCRSLLGLMEAKYAEGSVF